MCMRVFGPSPECCPWLALDDCPPSAQAALFGGPPDPRRSGQIWENRHYFPPFLLAGKKHLSNQSPGLVALDGKPKLGRMGETELGHINLIPALKSRTASDRRGPACGSTKAS